MNIAIIGPAHPLRGGLSTFDETLAGKLQQMGHDVVIYSFSLQYPSFLFPGKTQYTEEPAPAGLKIETLINSVNPINWLRTGRYIRRKRHDLIIVRYWLPFMGPSLGTILRQVKKNRHTHVLCIADNVIPHERRPGDTIFTKYFLKPIDSFITMSKEVLADLKTFTSKPALFTPHPLYDVFEAVSQESAQRKLALDPKEKYLLFFGFIRKYKGLDLLLEAMNDERIRSSNIRLIVAGEFYGDQKYYEELIEKYNLKGSLRLFTDFIPNEAVKYYFSAADLVVLPYRNATQSGITQVAYQFEKPMIITDVGGLAEVVPDGKVGFVAQPEAGSIASAILKFFQPGSIPDLEQHIQAEKKKYSWELFIERLMEAANSNS